MDDETKSRFDAVDTRLDAVEGKIDRLAASLDGRFASLAKLIEDHSESLQQEMATSVDRLEAATARNTKVLTGGSKAVAGFQKWSEKRDELDRKRDKEIRDLRARIQKLERNSNRRAGSTTGRRHRRES